MGKTATREAYGKALAELIVENEKVVVLDADLTKSTKTSDAKKALSLIHIFFHPSAIPIPFGECCSFVSVVLQSCLPLYPVLITAFPSLSLTS